MANYININPSMQRMNAVDDFSRIACEVRCGLAKLREEDVCTDFVVVVKGKSFRCHKAVLASVSDYFKAMFTSGMKESIQNETTIDNIRPEIFEVLLNLLYMKNVSDDPLEGISDEDIVELLLAADMLQMPCITDACMAFFPRTMSASNCIKRLYTGRASELATLTTLSWDFILKNFENIVPGTSLYFCEYEDFIKIIKDKNLFATDEVSVWRAISGWVKFDEQNRVDKIAELINCCCLTEISHQFLIEKIAFDPLIRKNDEALVMVQDAIRFKYHPSIHGYLELKHRTCMNKYQVDMFLGSDEEHDGLLLAYVKDKNDPCISLHIEDGPEEGYGCCSHGNNIYVSGGNGTHGKNLYEFSGTTQRWTKCKGAMPKKLRDHTMAACDGNLYAISGLSGEVLSWAVFQYCLGTRIWTRHGEVITPVVMASAVCVDEKLYIIGGFTEDEECGEEAVVIVQEYDLNTNSATIFCDLPSPCGISNALLRHDTIYIATSKGEILQLQTSEKQVELVASIPDFDKDSKFGMSLRNSLLSVYWAEKPSFANPVENETAVVRPDNNDTTVVNLKTGSIERVKTFNTCMKITGCASIVMHETNCLSNCPPAVPPRTYLH